MFQNFLHGCHSLITFVLGLFRTISSLTEVTRVLFSSASIFLCQLRVSAGIQYHLLQNQRFLEAHIFIPAKVELKNCFELSTASFLNPLVLQ